MRRIALIALVALIATPAMAHKGKSAASTTEATASDQAAPTKDKAPQKTCRTYEMTGSHAKPERLCLTKDEWRKFDDGQ
jgi:uncharacterized protein YdeI (BOF family)